MRRILIGLSGVAAAFALGCASPTSDEQLEVELRHQASLVRELGSRPRIVVCNAGSRIDVWGQMLGSRAEGPSSRAQAMARGFARATRARVGYVVGGPYPELVDQLLLDALRASGRGPLPGLVLLHVSREPPQQELVQEARRRQVKLVHRLLVI